MTPKKETLQAMKEFMAATPAYSGLTAAQAALLMSKKQSGDPKVYASKPYTKGEFMLRIAPVVIAIAGASPELKGKWLPILDLLKSAPDTQAVDAIDPTMQGMFAGLVADGLMAQGLADAVTAGGRSEVLTADASRFGYASVSEADITAALKS